MSNSNTNLQTQSSNALHNAIMEAGSKDRPPMLAPDTISTPQLMLGPMHVKMWKPYERLKKQGESLVMSLKTAPIHILYDILKHSRMKSMRILTEGLSRTVNPIALVAQQQRSFHPPNIPTQTLNIPPPERNSLPETEEKQLENVGHRYAKVWDSVLPTARNSGHVSKGMSETQKRNKLLERMILMRSEEQDLEDRKPIICTWHNFKKLPRAQLTTSGPIFDDEPMHKEQKQ
ncbi:hypothetical protein Tco_0771182 [Tanacetum coccineum]|uniref:Uncharacterized protein n=1 Tax=Tanacetum coccineum TaxID=301880 RepID=A0ABQ4ZGX0_9ASTR